MQGRGDHLTPLIFAEKRGPASEDGILDKINYDGMLISKEPDCVPGSAEEDRSQTRLARPREVAR